MELGKAIRMRMESLASNTTDRHWVASLVTELAKERYHDRKRYYDRIGSDFDQ